MSSRRPIDRPRAALALSAAVFAIPLVFVLLVPHPLEQPVGVDFQLYREVTMRWLGGGPFYQPYQLAGPYPISAGDVLYPPVALWLFVPFSFTAAAPIASFLPSSGGSSRSGSWRPSSWCSARDRSCGR